MDSDGSDPNYLLLEHFPHRSSLFPIQKCRSVPTMDREANLPAQFEFDKKLTRQTNPETTSSSSSSSSPGFLRHVQAAFKRHRPLGNYFCV